MILTLVNHYTGAREILSGSDARVRKDLLYRFPQLLRLGSHPTLEDLLKEVSRWQAWSVVKGGGDQDLQKTDQDGASGSVDVAKWVAAARFLAGAPQNVAEDAPPRLTVEFETDPGGFALQMVGLAPSDANRAALDSVLQVARLTKSVMNPLELKKCSAVFPDGDVFAALIQNALDSGEVKSAGVHGRHSDEAIIATDLGGVDPTHRRFLLKPHHGFGVGPTRPRRAAAFYQAAKIFGLDQWFPETHLVVVDSKEYSAAEWLPHGFKTVLEQFRTDLNAPSRLFGMFLPDGTTHRWAALDYILGNPDRHMGNGMFRGSEVYFIDPDESFSENFCPGSDTTFTPFYLRILTGAWFSEFNKLSVAKRAEVLPRINPTVADLIQAWLTSIDTQALRIALQNFGVDAAPVLTRLGSLTQTGGVPMDLVINRAWSALWPGT